MNLKHFFRFLPKVDVELNFDLVNFILHHLHFFFFFITTHFHFKNKWSHIKLSPHWWSLHSSEPPNASHVPPRGAHPKLGLHVPTRGLQAPPNRRSSPRFLLLLVFIWLFLSLCFFLCFIVLGFCLPALKRFDLVMGDPIRILTMPSRQSSPGRCCYLAGVRVGLKSILLSMLLALGSPPLFGFLFRCNPLPLIRCIYLFFKKNNSLQDSQ